MVCLGMLCRVPLADTNGRWAGHDALQTCPFPSLASCMQVYAASSSYIYWGVYNFQRWMSRFEQRWRVQRSAISIVNCRIPWADRDLNTYCAFGIFLKACVLQCLFALILKMLLYVYIHVMVCCSSNSVDIRVDMCLRVRDWQDRCVSISLQILLCLKPIVLAALWVLLSRFRFNKHYVMKLGLQTRWI